MSSPDFWKSIGSCCGSFAIRCDNTITFNYKDYHACDSKDGQQQLTISIDEFNRRYEQHILPHRFVKIRHYGYLKNYQRTSRLKKMFALMKLPPPQSKVRCRWISILK
ncbi:MAG: transposase [Ferruginibacter sp.]